MHVEDARSTTRSLDDPIRLVETIVDFGTPWFALPHSVEVPPDDLRSRERAAALAARLHVEVEPSMGAGKIAAAENVRAALAMVERRQAPLGIVYETDARATSAVRIVGVFPATSHPPITYPLALLSRSSHREAAAFHRFLLSQRGKAIFRRYGFGTR